MNTATWEVLPTLGALRLNLNLDFDIWAINRTDANGSAPLRLRQEVLPAPAGVLNVDDYEAADGPVSYTLTGYRADFSAASYTLAATMALDGPWLGVPIMQTYSQRLVSVLEYAAEIPGRNSIIEPLSRADPIVILRRMGLRRGDVRLWAGSHAAALSIIGALSKGEVMMLRQPEHAGMDMYFVADRAGVATLAAEGPRTVFGVAVTYQEVARPAGFLAAAPGWDFAQIAAAYPDFLSVASTYPDLVSLTLNEPTP